MKRKIILDGTEFEIDIVNNNGSFQVTVNNNQYNFKITDNDDKEQLKVESVNNGSGVYSALKQELRKLLNNSSEQLNVDGVEHQVKWVKQKKKQHESNSQFAGDVIALMPGTVVKIEKAQGDSVSKGDVVLILEAMKMENEILSLTTGILKKIAVSEGQTVKKGDLLFSVTN